MKRLIKKVKNTKKFKRTVDFFREDDHWLLIKIEVCILTGWIFLLVGVLGSVRPGIPSVSVIIEDSRGYKFWFIFFIIWLLALADHHSRYHSHNFALRTMNFFRLLTCFCLAAGVSVFDVYTYQNTHYAFVLTTCIFFVSAEFAAAKAIFDKERRSSSHFLKKIPQQEEDVLL